MIYDKLILLNRTNNGAGIGFFTSSVHPLPAPSEIYSFSSDSIFPGPNLLYHSYVGGGVSNATMAVITGGFYYEPYGVYSQKYEYAGGTLSITTSLNTSKAAHRGIGNTTVGIFGGGHHGVWDGTSYDTRNIDKYTYSSGTMVTSGLMSRYRTKYSGCGNLTTGIWAGGTGYPDTFTSSTEKYAYSGDTITAGSNLSSLRFGHTATGNGNFGIIAGGNGTLTATTAADKYTYAGDVRVAGTSLHLGSYLGVAAGTNTIGLFMSFVDSLGYNIYPLVVDKYIYSNGSVVTSRQLAISPQSGTAGSNAGNGLT